MHLCRVTARQRQFGHGSATAGASADADSVESTILLVGIPPCRGCHLANDGGTPGIKLGKQTLARQPLCSGNSSHNRRASHVARQETIWHVAAGGRPRECNYWWKHTIKWTTPWKYAAVVFAICRARCRHDWCWLRSAHKLNPSRPGSRSQRTDAVKLSFPHCLLIRVALIVCRRQAV